MRVDNRTQEPTHRPVQVLRTIGSQHSINIKAISDLGRADLSELWQDLYRSDLPKGISTSLMKRAIAYKLQAQHYRGLKPSLARQLSKIVNSDSAKNGTTAKQIQSLDPGARLVREWNSETHTVDVTEDGYEWQGHQYRSLSKIARLITGARWSGPRFFGLNGARP